MPDKTILVIGTYDTKNEELTYMVERIQAQGGGTLTMDISVLGDPACPTDISKHDVAQAADSTIQAAIASEDDAIESIGLAAGGGPARTRRQLTRHHPR